MNWKIHAPKFTHKFTLGSQIHENVKFARILYKLEVDDVVGWAASLDPSTDVIHIDLRIPTRNSYLAGKVWARTLWRETAPPTPLP